ncbi:hypothetical protein HPB50_011647 [Hyalomma asiaticum]|uniref:Uncharacterized protein n=1 Tax=Hyalomma asiaticum TaxID=266040 RepID=A0ACB7SLV0_HYAAI|nr:hypothetical protein HPB50_011647 [Hyalomma asiaticum]
MQRDHCGIKGHTSGKSCTRKEPARIEKGLGQQHLQQQPLLTLQRYSGPFCEKAGRPHAAAFDGPWTTAMALSLEPALLRKRVARGQEHSVGRCPLNDLCSLLYVVTLTSFERCARYPSTSAAVVSPSVDPISYGNARDKEDALTITFRNDCVHVHVASACVRPNSGRKTTTTDRGTR